MFAIIKIYINIYIHAIRFFLIVAGLNKVIRANVTINFELKSISKRLSKLESGQRNDAELIENDMAMIMPLLPLQTIKSIKEFENLIISNKVATLQFVSYFLFAIISTSVYRSIYIIYYIISIYIIFIVKKVSYRKIN